MRERSEHRLLKGPPTCMFETKSGVAELRWRNCDGGERSGADGKARADRRQACLLRSGDVATAMEPPQWSHGAKVFGGWALALQ